MIILLLLKILTAVLVLGIFYSFSRILSRKTHLLDKLIAYDILSGLFACLLVTLMILLKDPLLLSLVTSLIVLSFLATLGLARLLAEGEDVES